MQSQAFGARCSWQVTDPEAAGATIRSCAKMDIAKGSLHKRALAVDGHQKWGAMAHVAAVLVHFVFRTRERKRGAANKCLGNFAEPSSRSLVSKDHCGNDGRIKCDDRAGRNSSNLRRQALKGRLVHVARASLKALNDSFQ